MKKILYLLFAVMMIAFSSCKKEETIKFDMDPKSNLQMFKSTLENVKNSITQINPDFTTNSSLIKSTLNEEKAMDLLTPLIVQSKKLLKSYNFLTEFEIEFNKDDKKILMAALMLYDKEKWQIDGVIKTKPKNFTSALSTSNSDEIRMALERGELTKCLVDAFGLAGGFSAIYYASTKMAIKGLVTFAISVAGRSLSWVGLAYTAYDLSMCLYEENLDQNLKLWFHLL